MEYSQVIIKEGKNPKDYFPKERRAEILKLITEAGHPDAINKMGLARRYGISHSQIWKDMKLIKNEIKVNIGTDADVIMETVFRKVIKKGIKSENFRDNLAAAQAAKGWYDWLFDSGVKQKVQVPGQQVNIMVKMSQEDAIVGFIKSRSQIEQRGANVGQPKIDAAEQGKP